MTHHDHASTIDGETGTRTGRSRRGVLKAGVATTIGTAVLSGRTLASADVPVDPDDFHLYLLFGQSNMEGTGEIESKDRETNPRVLVLQDKTCPNLDREYGEWYVAEPPLNRCWAGLGPGDYFGKTMADELPKSTSVGLVPAAVGGSDIALFQKGAPIGRNGRDIPEQFSGGYEWLLDLAQNAQEVGEIKGILFHQGETNTADPEWKYQVQEIVADLRTDLGIGNVPFLAGELLYEENGGCCGSHNPEIRQLPELIPNAHVVSAEGLEGADEAHFTSEGYRELGRRYAETMLSVQYLDDTEEEQGLPPVGDNETPPQDLDGDGLYQDVDGDGELTHDDVSAFFEHLEDETVQNNPEYFDFAETDEIGFNDVIELLRRV